MLARRILPPAAVAPKNLEQRIGCLGAFAAGVQGGSHFVARFVIVRVGLQPAGKGAQLSCGTLALGCQCQRGPGAGYLGVLGDLGRDLGQRILRLLLIAHGEQARVSGRPRLRGFPDPR